MKYVKTPIARLLFATCLSLAICLSTPVPDNCKEIEPDHLMCQIQQIFLPIIIGG